MTSETVIELADGERRMEDSDFVLLGIPARFGLDRALLDARWKALQAEVHPDRFAARGAAAQRVAMQWAIRVNEAHLRLKDPLTRGAYLCELNGQTIAAETNTAMPAAFLMQQMEWREALDEARTGERIEALADEVAAREKAMHANLGVLIDERRDWAAAAAEVRALMFLARFAQDVDRRLDALGR